MRRWRWAWRFSASQDIVLDAYRREGCCVTPKLGLGNTVHISAYRLASLVPGSLSLILADRLPWPWVFAITALLFACCRRTGADPVGPRAGLAACSGAKPARCGGDAIQSLFPAGTGNGAPGCWSFISVCTSWATAWPPRCSHAVLSGHRL